MRLFIISLLSDIRRLPRPVYILVFGQFLNRFGSFVYPFLTLFLQDKAYGLGQIGGVLAAISHGNFFGPMAGGYLADAIGRRNTIVLSLITSALSLFTLYL
jgi:MFS family permease